MNTFIVTDCSSYKEYPIQADRCDIVDGSIILSNSCTDLIASFSAKDFFVIKHIESTKESDLEEEICKDINQWQEYAKSFNLCLKDCEKLTAYEQGKKTVYVKDMNNLASRQNQYIVHEDILPFSKETIEKLKDKAEVLDKILKQEQENKTKIQKLLEQLINLLK